MRKQRKLVLLIATSLDGYIATKDDSLDWLFKVEGCAIPYTPRPSACV